ncbi:hypothetical protein SAMN04488523_108143 [Sulfitobacter brevis]|uniref:Uncharacterized protein n=1 Tax=Sulfitobacter brevis TaxID=74348 RepID=A0A1I2BLD1_9RHOB|nr:hypothetical protein [Sulfitobacter brevis]SFE57012.1 hypothetical protein SAMN04488523_108143 [Sulfitobacter brevis]
MTQDNATESLMTPREVETLFTRADGSFAFARWGRPIAPVVFGVEDTTLSVVKGALEAVVTLAGHDIAETDPELGSNLMVFFLRDWAELTDVSGMAGLVPELEPLLVRLQAADANQYRFFRFDAAGAIKACFVFLRMDAHLAEIPADTLALGQMVQAMLLWSDTAFRDQSPLAVVGKTTILRPEISGLVRAAYDPVLPLSAQDPSHALRLAARLAVQR